jgi:AcrR family transcriptional regulator
MRPVKKQAYHHGDLARALVAAAVELISKKGPEAFTLREVAAAVGVTHGAAYRHFADKTALLAAVSEDGYRALAARLTEAAAATSSADPIARLRLLASEYVAFAVERPAHIRVMHGPRLNEDGRFPSLEAAIASAFSVVYTEMKQGQEAGVFRESPRARDLALGVWVTTHGYVELVARRRLKVKSPRVAVEFFGTLFDVYLDGLRRSHSP